MKALYMDPVDPNKMLIKIKNGKTSTSGVLSF